MSAQLPPVQRTHRALRPAGMMHSMQYPCCGPRSLAAALATQLPRPTLCANFVIIDAPMGVNDAEARTLNAERSLAPPPGPPLRQTLAAMSSACIQSLSNPMRLTAALDARPRLQSPDVRQCPPPLLANRQSQCRRYRYACTDSPGSPRSLCPSAPALQTSYCMSTSTVS